MTSARCRADSGLPPCGRVGESDRAGGGSGGTDLPLTWLDEQLHTLKHEGPTAVLAILRARAAHHPHLEEVGTALANLEKRAGQRQYPRYQAAGWPIGSGMVESANKLVMQARLKGAGMHWLEANVNPMLA